MNDNQVQPFTAEDLKEDVIEMLKTIFDPEIPVNIYELGLIYEIDVSESLGRGTYRIRNHRTGTSPLRTTRRVMAYRV